MAQRNGQRETAQLMTNPARQVTVTESGDGPYAQLVKVGRHVISADESETLGGRDLGPTPYGLHSVAVRDELDRLCHIARASKDEDRRHTYGMPKY